MTVVIPDGASVEEIRTLRDYLLASGYPTAVAEGEDDPLADRAAAVVVFRGGVCDAPSEKTVVCDKNALALRADGASAEVERVRERIGEILELRAGVRYDCFSGKLYSEKNGVSVFLGKKLDLTEKERLIVRLFETASGSPFTARELVRFTSRDPGSAGDGAMRSLISDLNAKARGKTGFPLILNRRGEGYYFTK
ncbi:MAG: helix-turn-helix domain-containing protein [Clostridia bacterium]|nr:helix-turn-helix domain-containing protein [Clostridia bacterium]